MPTVLEQFYQEPFVAQPVIMSKAGTVLESDIRLSSEHVFCGAVPDDVRNDLGRKMVQLYESIEPITVKVRQAGEMRPYTFEVSYIEQGAADDTELRISSYSSSFTGNPGNVTEVAEWAVQNPSRSYAYVASPGNGLTSPLARDERHYFRRYGRLLHEDQADCEALPIVRALHLALKERGIVANRLASDSAGAVMTTAYGATTASSGSIQSIHQNVRPNIENRSYSQMVYGMVYLENMINGPRHAKSTLDPLSIPKWDAFVRQHIPQSYQGKQYRVGKSAPMLLSYAIGLSRGAEAGDPALADNTAFLRNNDTADILFTNGREDPLVNPTTIDTRMRFLCSALSRHTSGRVSAVIVDSVSHGLHTFYPQFVQQTSRAVLG
jgi:hypothetical protein